jgi:hypothetical protein
MNTTRKYPRTLEQAFGPYARGPIHEQQDPMPRADKIVVITGCVVGIFLLVATLAGWLQ